MKTKNYTSLVLTKKWFDMILSGEKTEEYRDIHTFGKITNKHKFAVYVNWFLRKVKCPFITEAIENSVWEVIQDTANQKTIDYVESFLKKYEYVYFYLGYAKNRPMMKVKLNGIHIGKGKEEWGADRFETYFVLSLGEIIETNNI